MVRFLPLLALMAVAPVLATEPDAFANESPYISVNIGVEISGLEQAATQAAEGLSLIGESLDRLADNPDLTPEQNRQVQSALSRIDNLGASLNQTVEQLPRSIERGFEPVVATTRTLSKQARQILIIACVILILIIIAAFAAVYYFVLAPATRSIVETTTLLNKLANTLESTALIAEKAGQQNREVLDKLDALQQRLQPEKVDPETGTSLRSGNQPRQAE